MVLKLVYHETTNERVAQHQVERNSSYGPERLSTHSHFSMIALLFPALITTLFTLSFATALSPRASDSVCTYSCPQAIGTDRTLSHEANFSPEFRRLHCYYTRPATCIYNAKEHHALVH